jgi:hypothetical protein
VHINLLRVRRIGVNATNPAIAATAARAAFFTCLFTCTTACLPTKINCMRGLYDLRAQFKCMKSGRFRRLFRLKSGVVGKAEIMPRK